MPGLLQPRRYEAGASIAVLLVEVAAMSQTAWLWAAAGLFLLSSTTLAEELPSTGEPTSDQIAALIEQLDRPEFADRQAASQQLEEAGLAALPPLESIAASGSREVASRAFNVLNRHAQSGADDLKQAAREALSRLAQSNNASTAQRARNILNPPQPTSMISPGMPQGMPPGMPPPRMFGGAFGAGPGGFRQLRISDINGRRVVDLDERERRVVMVTAPAGDIQVEVTDKQNGRKRTLDAKSTVELAGKDPEIGRLYDQHNGPGQRQAGAGNMAPPFGIAPPPAAPADIAQRQLEIIDSLLERYKQRLNGDPSAQRVIESLEALKQRTKADLPASDAPRVLR